MRGRTLRSTVIAAAAAACAAVAPMHAVRAVSVPDAPTLGGTIRILADNDFALLAGDANNVTRMILQNDAVWMDQQTAATTYHISLNPGETYLYLLAMGGGGGEDIGGLLNGVDITQIASGPDGLQRATGRAGGNTSGGYLLLDDFFADWNSVGLSGDTTINAEWGKYAAPMSGIQAALTGATWGDPPAIKYGGVGGMITGKAFDVPSVRAVMFRFKGTSLGTGFASAGDSLADVAWTAPASDGGSAILDYTARAYRASDNSDTGLSCTTPDGTTTNCRISGLTNGVGYYFKITARNSAGSSVPSDATATVTPNDFTPPVLALAAPQSTSVVNSAAFTVTGNEAISCTTLSSTPGVDLTVTGGTLAAVAQTNATTCTVTVTTAVAAGATGNVVLTKAAGFSMTDVAGNAQTSISGSPATVAIAIPAPTTTTTTTTTTSTTTTTPPTTTTAAPTTTVAAATAPASNQVEPSLELLTTTTLMVPAGITSTTVRLSTPVSSSVVPATTTTVAPTTTTARPFDGVIATAIPAGEPAPDAPVTDPGDVRATVDGSDAQVSVSRSNGSIIVSSSEFAFAATAVDAKNSTVPLDSSGSLSVTKASNVNVRTIGLAPTSEVDAWMMSTPTPLGRVTTDPSGVVKGSFPVPGRIEPGAHRIVLAGTTKSGKKVVLSIGVRVADTKKTTVKWSWVFLGLIGIASFFALVIPARRRDDDDDEMTPAIATQ